MKKSVALCLMLVACVRVVTPEGTSGDDSCVSDEECSTGYCVEGICCNTACTDGCHTCVLPGSEGRCVPAGDNTDDKGACDPCFACFNGVCQSSLLATTPKDECPESQTCNGLGECGLAIGQGCDAVQGTACATGYCLVNMCGEGEEAFVSAPYADTTAEFPMRVLDTAEGVAILSRAQSVRVEQGLDDSSCPTLQGVATMDALHFQLVTPLGSIHDQVFPSAVVAEPADLVHVNDDLWVVYAACNLNSCEVLRRSVSTGEDVPVVASGVPRPYWLRTATSPAGQVAVMAVEAVEVSMLPVLWWVPQGDALLRFSVDVGFGSDVTPDLLYADGVPVLLAFSGREVFSVAALTVDAQGQLVKAESSPVPNCPTALRIRGRSLGDGHVHVVAQCASPAGDPLHTVELDLDVTVPGVLTLGEPAEVAFDPARTVPLNQFALGGPPGVHGFFFTQGPSVRLAWRSASGSYTSVPLTTVGSLEEDVLALEVANGAYGSTLAWSPGHVVHRSTVSPTSCWVVTFDDQSARLAAASFWY